MNTEVEQIQEELAKRELARRSFLHYLYYVFPGFQDFAYQGSEDNKIHHKIIDPLEKVERGEIKRLMIFCPPRLGKSAISTQYFTSWFLGRNPNKNIITSSYSGDIAKNFGRKTKQITQSPTFDKVFPDFQLSDDKKEGGNRETKEGGGYYSAGVGGSITGRGGDVIVIDDPVKDREQANSPTIQSKVIDWYDSVLSTRLQNQNSAIILIMTRWNQNDLGGFLEKEENNGGDKREKVVIQGIDKDGNEIVRPGKWDKGYMMNLRKKMLKENRYALYQQDPINATNGIFKRDMFSYFKLSDFEKADGILKKSDLEIGIFIDPAFSTSKNSDDATVMAYGKHKITKSLYQLDGYADTSAPTSTISALISMINRMNTTGYQIKFIHCESAKINRDQTEFIKRAKKELILHDIHIPFYTTEVRGKKEDRIKNEAEPVMTGQAFFMRSDGDQNFLIKMENQFLDFPNGKHDDIIDNIAQAIKYFRKKGNGEENEEDRYGTVYNIDRDNELF